MHGQLRLELLGPPSATVDGQPLKVDTRKALAVLAVLAVDGPQHRGALAALLWPDSETSKARGALRRTLSVLGRGLGDRWLVLERDRVALAGDGFSSDVTDVARLMETVDEHQHDDDARCGVCRQALNEVVALHRGELLEGFGMRNSPEFEDWCAEHAESHRRLLCRAFDLHTRATLAVRDLEATIGGLEQWLDVDPLNEQVHLRLMLVHAWRGERSEAIRRYRACVAVLDAELGVAPLPRTTQLYRAILEDRVPVMTAAAPVANPDPVTQAAHGALAPPQAAAWPLIGRDAELAAARQHLRACRPGALLVFTGEAGIGKTRLAETLLEQRRVAGARTATARCYTGETELAFGPIVDLLRQAVADDGRDVAALPDRTLAEARRLAPSLLPERTDLPLPPPLDSPGARAVLFDAVWDTLEAGLAGQGPGVVLFDDLQAVDPSTLELLGYGLRRLAGRTLTVVLCLRAEEAPPALLELLEEPPLARLSHAVDLQRLPADVTSTLVTEVLQRPDADEVARRLQEESEGLPLLLTEYLRLIVGGEVDPQDPEWVLPHGAIELVRSRTAGLSEPARQLATTAAAVGRSFDLDVVQQSSGRTPEEVVDGLEELLAARLVREVPAGNAEVHYDFAHDKVRVGIYAMATAARRRLLHGRIMDVLTAPSRRRRVSPPAAVIAEHAIRAGRDEDATHWLVRAGEHARTLFANREALEHFERAIGLGLTPTWGLRMAIADVQTLLGDYRAAIATLEAAAALTTDPAESARTEQQLGAVHLRRGDVEVARAHLEAAWDLLPAEDAPRRGQVATDLGLLRLREGDLDAAAGHAEEALELGTLAGEAQAQAQALNLLGVVARHRGDPAEACRHLEEGAALAEKLDDPAAYIGILNNLALSAADAGDLARAIALQREAVEAGSHRGDRHREAALRNNLADLLHLAGRDEEAMQALEAAVELFAGVDRAADPTPEIWQLVDW